MARAGAQEILMSGVQPAELWQESVVEPNLVLNPARKIDMNGTSAWGQRMRSGHGYYPS